MKELLIEGNCLLVMDQIKDKSIDMVLCDLPYGKTKCKWDTPIDLDLLWKQYKRIIKPNGAILLFAQTPFDKVLGFSNIRWLKYEWIWEKPLAKNHFNAKIMPMYSHENILVFYDKKPTYNPQMTTGHKPINSYTKRKDVCNKSEIYGKVKVDISGGGETIRYPRTVQKFSLDTQKCSLHPTQKPVALLEYLIKTYTNVGDLVLDNTAGSGSTGVASRNTNRNFILIEDDPKYIQIIKNRLNI